jgi:aspartyl-tRNA(Asn)/glutamyl-tRNA(Gln) amidotransferase subunit A
MIRTFTYFQSRIPTVSIKNDPDISELRVGIPQEYYCSDMSDEVIEAWGQVADLLEDNGVKVVPVSMPHTAYSITCYQVLNPCEVASNMAR